MTFLLGMAVSACWMLVNSFFLMRLVKMAGTPAMPDAGKQKSRIFALSLVKFPLLYVVGYFILRGHYFPMASILTGLTVSLFILTAIWFRMRMA